MKNKYQIWECKIVVSINSKLPDGFDSPPRIAAINAIEKQGIHVLNCFSGWGGKLSKYQKIVNEEQGYKSQPSKTEIKSKESNANKKRKRGI